MFHFIWDWRDGYNYAGVLATIKKHSTIIITNNIKASTQKTYIPIKDWSNIVFNIKNKKILNHYLSTTVCVVFPSDYHNVYDSNLVVA